LDRIDVGVLVPVVHSDLQGRSQAQVIPFGDTVGGAANTFIDGTPSNPVLTATNRISGGATGLGDVVGRVKINLVAEKNRRAALFSDVRFPTGDEANLLGSGHYAYRVMGVISDRFGGFSPHASLGYLYWHGGPLNDDLVATVGFDQLVRPWATVAVSFLAQGTDGSTIYRTPRAITVTQPSRRTVEPIEVPESGDDALSVSIGGKLTVLGGTTLVVNTLFPVVHGGPRPDFVWTLGLERSF
jgi:hypothetical protein